MTELMEKYLEFVDRYKANHGDMLAYDCPCCGEIILTPPAPEDEKWDSEATCPHCEGLYVKYATSEKAHGVAV